MRYTTANLLRQIELRHVNLAWEEIYLSARSKLASVHVQAKNAFCPKLLGFGSHKFFNGIFDILMGIENFIGKGVL